MRTAALLLALLPLIGAGCSPRMAHNPADGAGAGTATAPPGPAGGGGAAGATETPGPEADLAAARARWMAAGLASYTYTIQRVCFCPPTYLGPFEVTVEGGRIVGVTREGVALDPGDAMLPTVEELFDMLAHTYTSGGTVVRVSYDPARGYPTDFRLDPDATVIDEEIGYVVSGLESR